MSNVRTAHFRDPRENPRNGFVLDLSTVFSLSLTGLKGSQIAQSTRKRLTGQVVPVGGTQKYTKIAK
jgi:hypothetical protein